MSTMLSLVLARFHPQFEDFQIPSEEATPDTLLLHPSSDGTDPAPADQDRGQAGRAQEAPLREEHPEREVAAAAVAAASSSSSSSSSATVGLGDSVVSIDIPDEDASPVAGSSPLGKDGLTDLDTDPESTAAAVEEVKEDTPPGLEPPLQAAPRLTRFIRERGVVIRCVALAPPMIVSRNLAQSRLALTVVTSIVYGHVSVVLFVFSQHMHTHTHFSLIFWTIPLCCIFFSPDALFFLCLPGGRTWCADSAFGMCGF